MVHLGRAEIVTVTLLCNKPACRKQPEAVVHHRILSALPVLAHFISRASSSLLVEGSKYQWLVFVKCFFVTIITIGAKQVFSVLVIRHDIEGNTIVFHNMCLVCLISLYIFGN